jgi:hypothetical protein
MMNERRFGGICFVSRGIFRLVFQGHTLNRLRLNEILFALRGALIFASTLPAIAVKACSQPYP